MYHPISNRNSTSQARVVDTVRIVLEKYLESKESLHLFKTNWMRVGGGKTSLLAIRNVIKE